jgi:hypothetical protein
MSFETLIAFIASFVGGIAVTLASQRALKTVGWRMVRLWLVALGIVAIIVLAIVLVATQ